MNTQEGHPGYKGALCRDTVMNDIHGSRGARYSNCDHSHARLSAPQLHRSTCTPMVVGMGRIRHLGFEGATNSPHSRGRKEEARSLQ